MSTATATPTTEVAGSRARVGMVAGVGHGAGRWRVVAAEHVDLSLTDYTRLILTVIPADTDPVLAEQMLDQRTHVSTQS